MLDFAIELLNTRTDEGRLDRLYGLVFGGRVGQPGYFLGQQMSAEIVNDFGAKSLPCLLKRAPEYSCSPMSALTDTASHSRVRWSSAAIRSVRRRR